MTQPLTEEEAKNLCVGNTLYLIGRYDITGEPSKCRVNGKVVIIKRDSRFRVPIKRGMREYGYVTENNYNRFTLEKPDSIDKKLVKEYNSRFTLITC